MKKLAYKIISTIITLCLAISSVTSQSSEVTTTPKISLDKSSAINADHQYIDHFTSQGDDYITWLYTMNRVNMKNTPEYANPAKLVKNSSGNNSLIFRITEGEAIRYDTLRNSVHPGEYDTGGGFLGLKKLFGKWRAKSFLSKQNLQGDLPEGAMMWVEAKRWGLKFGVLVPERQADVKVTISNLDGDVIDIVVDESLSKGWNNYKWSRGKYRKGTYRIHVTIEESTLSQNFSM